MPTIQRNATVPYNAQQMYDLVNGIEQYPEFVPWCDGAEVLHRSPDTVKASLSFSRGGMQKSFTTVNRLNPHRMIEIALVDGPFKQLEGFWRFEALEGEEGSRVLLDLEFEFSSRILAMMFGPVFNQVAATLVDSFTQRAEDVYGS